MIIVSWLTDSGRGITINACMLDDYDCYATNERQLHEEQLHEEMVFSKNLCRLLNKASYLTAFYAWQSPSPGHPNTSHNDNF